MLKAYRCGDRRLEEIDVRGAVGEVPGVVWFDLIHPRPEDFAFVVRATGLALPEQADIVEIENSSRLMVEGDVLTMSMPIVARDAQGVHGGSCAFVVSPERLVTIRFAENLVFDHFPKQPHEVGKDEGGEHAAFIFVALLEAIVDRQADALETLRGELDQFSRRVFAHETPAVVARGQRKDNEEMELRGMLSTLGQAHDRISYLRDSQLGVARIAPFASASAAWLPAAVNLRLKVLVTDIASLNEFSVHLSDKVQFLLDATLGFINIAQSTLMKVFTVVAVIGIPPTLFAGIYGMNFQNMPELHWTYGYAYGWAVIILSAVIPWAWFKKRGWM